MIRNLQNKGVNEFFPEFQIACMCISELRKESKNSNNLKPETIRQ